MAPVVRNSSANAGWEGNGTPLQSSCLENPVDGGAWWAAVHGVAKSRTRLSDFTFNFHFHALEKEMATHSSVLAWRIPGTAEPAGLTYGVAQSRTRLKWLSSSSSSECRRHETRVQSLSWEDPLGEGMVTHSSIPAWRITWREEPRAWQATVHRVTQSQTQLKWLSTHTQHIRLLSTC